MIWILTAATVLAGTTTATSSECSPGGSSYATSACAWLGSTSLWPDPHATYPWAFATYIDASGVGHPALRYDIQGTPYEVSTLTDSASVAAELYLRAQADLGVHARALPGSALGWWLPIYVLDPPSGPNADQIHSMDAASEGWGGPPGYRTILAIGQAQWEIDGGAFYVDTSGRSASLVAVIRGAYNADEWALMFLSNGEIWTAAFPGPIPMGEVIVGP